VRRAFLLGKVLQHAVGKHLIERAIGEGQITAIRNHIVRLYSKMQRYLPSRADSFQRRIDSHGTIAHPGSSDAPPSLLTADLQESLAFSWGKPEVGNWIIREFAYQSDIQHAVRRGNDVLDERINFSRRRAR
jgi:hypothetical protein